MDTIDGWSKRILNVNLSPFKIIIIFYDSFNGIKHPHTSPNPQKSPHFPRVPLSAPWEDWRNQESAWFDARNPFQGFSKIEEYWDFISVNIEILLIGSKFIVEYWNFGNESGCNFELKLENAALDCGELSYSEAFFPDSFVGLLHFRLVFFKRGQVHFGRFSLFGHLLLQNRQQNGRQLLHSHRLWYL